MAKGTGIYGAYKGAKPNKQDFGDDLLQHEQMDLAQQANQRAKDDVAAKKAAAKKAAKEKKLKKMLGELDIQPFNTKIETGNQFVATAATRAIGEVQRLHKKLEADPNMSDSERARIQGEIDSLNKTPEYLKKFTDTYTKRMTDYQEKLLKGEVLKDEAFENKMKNYFLRGVSNEDGSKGYMDMEVGFKNGIVMIATKDTDGDGELDFEDVGSVLTGQLPDFEMAQTMDSLITQDKEKINTFKDTTGRNYNVTETIKLNDGSVFSIDENAKSYFRLDEDGKATAALKTYARDNGIDFKDINEQTVKDAREAYKQAMYGTQELGKSDKTDQKGIDARNLGRAKLAFKKKNSKSGREDKDHQTKRNMVEGIARGDERMIALVEERGLPMINPDDEEGKSYINVPVRITYTPDNQIVFEPQDDRFDDVTIARGADMKSEGVMQSLTSLLFKDENLDYNQLMDLSQKKANMPLGKTTSLLQMGKTGMLKKYKEIDEKRSASKTDKYLKEWLNSLNIGEATQGKTIFNDDDVTITYFDKDKNKEVTKEFDYDDEMEQFIDFVYKRASKVNEEYTPAKKFPKL